jgi:hypothetical protein
MWFWWIGGSGSGVLALTMSDPVWDARLKSFLKKTGDDFKRFSSDLKVEADRLLAEVQDPQRQQKVKEGLEDVGEWAKRTAEELSSVVEDGLKKAEVALARASKNVTQFVAGPAAAPAPRAKAPPPAAPSSPTPAARKARKTVGRSGKAGAPAAARPARKTLGKKPAAKPSR